MSENIEIRTKDEVQEGKPELVARLFCSMDDGQQAEFFSWCAAIEKEWQAEWKKSGEKGFFEPGSQWFGIGDKLAERGERDDGRSVVMAIAGPLYRQLKVELADIRVEKAELVNLKAVQRDHLANLHSMCQQLAKDNAGLVEALKEVERNGMCDYSAELADTALAKHGGKT